MWSASRSGRSGQVRIEDPGQGRIQGGLQGGLQGGIQGGQGRGRGGIEGMGMEDGDDGWRMVSSDSWRWLISCLESLRGQACPR